VLEKIIDYHIRLAAPSDVDALTELHCACFGPEDRIAALFGKDYVRATLRWQIRSPEAYILVAEKASAIAGFLGVYDRSYTWPMFRACFGDLLSGLVRHPGLVFNPRLWRRLFRRSRSGDSLVVGTLTRSRTAFVIVGAVSKEARGQGIFPALLQASERVSDSRGSQAILSPAYRANALARRAYRKAGWTEVPALATSETVCHISFLDPELAHILGFQAAE